MKVEKTMGKVLQIRNNVALMIILHVFSAGKISMPFIYLFVLIWLLPPLQLNILLPPTSVNPSTDPALVVLYKYRTIPLTL